MTFSRAFKTHLAAIIVVLLLFIGLSPFASANERIILSDYTQRLYNYGSGLAATATNDVLQTRDGYIWIAGYNGLLRFDGTRFVDISDQNPGLSRLTSVMVLFEDSKDRLWIGTNDQGAVVYDKHNYTFVAKEEGLSVTAFAEKNDGTILMGTKEGLYSVSPADGAYQPIDASVAVGSMLLDNKDRVWLVDLYGALVVPQDASFAIDTRYRYASIYETADGTLLLGTETGEILMAKANGDGYDKPRLIQTGLTTVINAFCEDLQGHLWVVMDAGLGRIESNAFVIAQGAQIGSSLENMRADYEGTLWIASQRGGLLQLIPSVIRDYSFAADLGEPVVNTAMDANGLSYIGTDDGLIILDNDFKKIENDLTALLSGIRVRCVTKAPNGDIWIAAYSKYGAVRYAADGSITVFNEENGLISNRARQVLVVSSGEIAVATGSGLSIIKDGAVMQSYGIADGLKNAVILCVAEDKQGKIYLGTDGGGIYMLENGNITPFGEKEIATKAILRILCDEIDDSLWIATGTGFYHYDGVLKPLAYITKSMNTVFDIIPLADGRICLLGMNGIICGDAQTLMNNGPELTVILNTGTLPFHITANSFNGIDEEGNLFLCGSKDVGRFNVKYLANNASNHRLVIDSVNVDNRVYTPEEAITLQSNTKRLTFNVVSPHFGFSEEIALDYRLEGFDTEPSTMLTHQEQSITYTNLPGGKYTFHIRVKNANGQYGLERTLLINKELTFFEHKGVQIGLAVAGLLLVFLISRMVIYLRTREALRKQAMYRKMTNQTILTISNAIDAKDKYTEGHSVRVAKYSVEVGKRMGLNEEELEQLHYIALLHDIGKIGITDTILNKPDRLNDDEFVIMKTHTSIGGDILKDFDSLPDISEGARAHHEKFDGTGYPNGLKGDEISLIARIIGVCDTYDAMATTRAYRKGLDKEIILKELERCKGTQFDPKIADIMIQMIKDGVMDENQKA